ncbi:Large exoprotein involved in heme utilization or adhesion (plasmid) [Nostoc flagelliforme CCNUN1]|uniref:Large exoprotein involved in heme utilization or adhesion n=1 Tax=Nostoc flagelliforme CCNUN1 TaxID=2038116 RepID=A0A2K8T6Q1_9NOSO|nr:filamentous hemagglutinin N-terminal domain-containing protein [Nostoc flagelliforme]AUB43352.1 Large exoprotein involved in heme utilization or adhesion [Nostoc flagelliforme CCNUN1]
MDLRSWFSCGCHLGLSSLLIIGTQGSDHTFAQVSADPSLGTKVESTDSTNYQIRGGTDVGGKNLFHSFNRFDIPDGGSASFINNPEIVNIFSRVTGGNPSVIQGLIRAQGNANLFLISPSGIIFGENAKLNIGGSFIGTTASAIRFPGSGEFSITSPVSPLNPLLRVNPSAFLFNQNPSQPIKSIQVVNQAILSVPESQSLVLLGGDVNLEGATLVAPDGRVELGGLAVLGTVGLNIDNNNFRLSFPDGVAQADVSLAEATRVTASGKGGGSIQVQGRRITFINDSKIAVNTRSKSGGTLAMKASESIELGGASSLSTQTQASGTAGELKIETGRLIIQDGSQVSASTSKESTGQGGMLSVTADFIQIVGTSPQGFSSSLFSVTQGTGNAGELKIDTGQLIVEDGGQVSASTRNQGRGGKLSITARDSIKLIGTKGVSRSGLFVGTEASGDAGNLEIETGQLIVQDRARISASTSSESTGQGGSIIVKTGELNVLNDADITVSSQGTKKAGDLEITARSIKLDNQAKLIAQANSGDGGNITLNLQDFLLLRRNSEISTSAGTEGAGGNGGNITINVPNGFIVSVPRENSDITANAFSGSGGRVTINAVNIFGIAPLSREDLQRLSSELDPRQVPTSDITANSQKNPSLSGTIQLNLIDIDPNSGLVELPTVAVETEVAQVCDSPGYAQSSFIITGSGGLPPNPTKDVLPNGTVEVGWVSLKPSSERSNPPITTRAVTTTPERIVEASGWAVNKKGEVVLTANVPAGDRGSWQKDVACSATHAHQ